MKNRILCMTAALILSFSGAAFAGLGGGGDASSYTQLQETAVFFNNSGGVLSAGDVVVIDTTGSGVASGTTLGAYVTTTTSADSTLAVGVVKTRSVADQRPVVVVTRGPVGAFCQNSSGTNVVAGTAVGTYTTAGACDGGTNLGVGIASGDLTDGKSTDSKTWIWVQGIGSE